MRVCVVPLPLALGWGGRKWRKEWTDVVVEIVSTTKIIVGITQAEKLERLLPASTFAKVLYF
jgi:hypothetical protein